MRAQRVLVALIVGGLITACNSPASPASSASPGVLAPASTSAVPSSLPPSASPSPSPTPAPWKTYTSKLFHYKMQHPPEWTVTPGSSKVADAYDHGGYPYVYVTRETVSGTVSVSLTVTRQVAAMERDYTARLVSNSSLKVAGGYRGRLLSFTGVDDGVDVVIQVAIVAKGNRGYFLTLFAERATAAADKRLFKRMYGTWRPT